MGVEVNAISYNREERQRYREKVRLNLDVFERMLNQSQFEFDRPMTGLEIELNLVDENFQPHFHNKEVLKAIADEAFQTELAQYNIELNVPPRPLPGDAAIELEEELRANLNHASERAKEVGSTIVAIGMLPTIMPEHYEGDWISDSNRYAALQDSVLGARGEDIELDIVAERPEILADGADQRVIVAAGKIRAADRARIRLHQRPIAPAGRALGVRRPLECRPGPGRSAARAGGQ